MKLQKMKCFVMMPSGLHNEYKDKKEESDFVFKGIIKRALVEEFNDNIEILRETDSNKSGAITRSIIENIAAADICIVDITGQNANVFFELGVRYSLRKKSTILLKQSDAINPFDTHAYRCVVYNPKYDGVEKAVQSIRESLKNISSSSAQPQYTDSLVFDVFPTMSVRIPNFIDEDIAFSTVEQMTWIEYSNQLAKILDRLRGVYNDGRLLPNAILGISNGGAMFADLLGRDLFKGPPIISLWADRQNKDGNFFDNPINDSIMKGIKKYLKQKGFLLLVDDIVASGNTVAQARNYLASKLKNAEIVFLPLFSRNEKYIDVIRDILIWKVRDFLTMTDNQISEFHATDRQKLPYGKEIRST